MKRRALAALIAMTATACATRSSSLIPLDADTPVEAHVLRHYQWVADLNASVGDPETLYSVQRRSDLASYQSIINHRLEGDLAREYPRGLRPASQTYLLLGRRGDHDIVQVIRLGSTEPDGAFERLPGVTYYFDPSTRALLDMHGTEY